MLKTLIPGGARRPLLAATAMLALSSGQALAAEASGKLVWIDQKNSALLLECSDGGCGAIPNAKKGETYTFIITDGVRGATGALQEGQTLTLVYDEAEDKSYRLTAIK
ncbi:MAG: hypothetical protein GC150_04965 [Rhizobiales bacterium]|nr:hypothetical protein [Hyphomicrobiales bacterium]